MKINKHSVVSLHYRLTNNGGEELDASSGGDPLVYLHGAQNIIPGLESALTGKAAGDELDVVVEPDHAYGPVHQELIQTVPHDAFSGIDEVQPGMQFEVQGPQGQSRQIVVTEVGEAGVEVDGNHPLAGETLRFEVRVESVREGTAEEIEHGHPHE